MHPKLKEPDRVPTVVEMMRAWLAGRGFALQDPTLGLSQYARGDGYFVRDTDIEDEYGVSGRYVAIGYRGDGRSGSRAKLREVAEVFEQLGVKYDVEENDYKFLKLIVRASDVLNAKLEAAMPVVVLPSSD